MKKLLMIASLLFGSLLAFAQPSIERSILSSAGTTDKNSEVILQWTLGELSIATVSDPQIVLTQGYNQPSDTFRTSINEAGFIISIKAYPNPVHQDLTIEISAPVNSKINVDVFNVLGQQVFHSGTLQLLANQPLKVSFNWSDWVAGSYLLTLSNENNTIRESLMIQKVTY